MTNATANDPNLLGRSINSSTSFDASRPRNEHFTDLNACVVDLDVLVGQNEALTFDYRRMLAGQEDVTSGRTRSLAEVMNALRARIRRNRD